MQDPFTRGLHYDFNYFNNRAKQLDISEDIYNNIKKNSNTNEIIVYFESYILYQIYVLNNLIIDVLKSNVNDKNIIFLCLQEIFMWDYNDRTFSTKNLSDILIQFFKYNNDDVNNNYNKDVTDKYIKITYNNVYNINGKQYNLVYIENYSNEKDVRHLGTIIIYDVDIDNKNFNYHIVEYDYTYENNQKIISDNNSSIIIEHNNILVANVHFKIKSDCIININSLINKLVTDISNYYSINQIILMGDFNDNFVGKQDDLAFEFEHFTLLQFIQYSNIDLFLIFKRINIDSTKTLVGFNVEKNYTNIINKYSNYFNRINNINLLNLFNKCSILLYVLLNCENKCNDKIIEFNKKINAHLNFVKTIWGYDFNNLSDHNIGYITILNPESKSIHTYYNIYKKNINENIDKLLLDLNNLYENNNNISKLINELSNIDKSSHEYTHIGIKYNRLKNDCTAILTNINTNKLKYEREYNFDLLKNFSILLPKIYPNNDLLKYYIIDDAEMFTNFNDYMDQLQLTSKILKTTFDKLYDVKTGGSNKYLYKYLKYKSKYTHFYKNS